MGTTGAASADYQFPGQRDCDRLNLAASFHPMTDDGTLPCAEVAGIQIYGYLDHTAQAVRVSIDLDTVYPILVRPDHTVPLLVQCGESTLFADTEQSAQARRRKAR